jgi:hypothetical protein
MSLIRIGAGAICFDGVRAIVDHRDLPGDPSPDAIDVYFKPAEKVEFRGGSAEALRRLVAELPDRPAAPSSGGGGVYARDVPFGSHAVPRPGVGGEGGGGGGTKAE